MPGARSSARRGQARATRATEPDRDILREPQTRANAVARRSGLAAHVYAQTMKSGSLAWRQRGCTDGSVCSRLTLLPKTVAPKRQPNLASRAFNYRNLHLHPRRRRASRLARNRHGLAKRNPVAGGLGG